MTTLRTIKKLILGETWILPVSLAITLAAAGLLHRLAVWAHRGGFLLLAAVLLILLASTNRSACKR
jgi:hypothetical protein